MTTFALIRRLSTRVGARSGASKLNLENVREARRVVERAEQALDAGELTAAESYALDAVLAAPGWLASLSLLGRVLDAQGRSSLAVECYRGRMPDEVWHRRYEKRDMGEAPVGHFVRTSVSRRERIAMPPPGGVAEPTHGVFNRNTIVAAPTFVDKLSRGRLWQDAQNTLVLDRSGLAVAQHSLGNPAVVRELMERHSARRYRGRVFVLGARGSGNYYHWLTDILPKVELCRLAGYRFERSDRFVVPTCRSAFQIETLQHLGIRENQLHVSHSDSPFVDADELIVPYLHNAMATTMGAWLPKFLKRTFVTENTSAVAGLRLFVSRDPARSQGRGLDNLADVNTFFKSRGFQVIFPERHSVLEQAQLFAEADVVAAPHGAGLANIVFCRPGTRVIEFYGAHLAPCYRAISALASLEYHAHYCLDAAPDQDEQAQARTLVARRTAGFAIDIDDASLMLDNAGVK